jgi:hypothetical protein
LRQRIAPFGGAARDGCLGQGFLALRQGITQPTIFRLHGGKTPTQAHKLVDSRLRLVLQAIQ